MFHSVLLCYFPSFFLCRELPVWELGTDPTYKSAGVGAVEAEERNRGLGGRRACSGGVGPDGGDWCPWSGHTGCASSDTTGEHVGRVMRGVLRWELLWW